MLGCSSHDGPAPYVTCLHSSQSQSFNTSKVLMIKGQNSMALQYVFSRHFIWLCIRGSVSLALLGSLIMCSN